MQILDVHTLLLVAVPLLLFMVVCILFEGIIIGLYRFNGYGRSIGQSALINCASLAVVYLVWPLLAALDVDADRFFPLFPLLWLTTVLLEGLLLKLMNRNRPWRRILTVSAVMNATSYGVLYLMLLSL